MPKKTQKEIIRKCTASLRKNIWFDPQYYADADDPAREIHLAYCGIMPGSRGFAAADDGLYSITPAETEEEDFSAALALLGCRTLQKYQRGERLMTWEKLARTRRCLYRRGVFRCGGIKAAEVTEHDPVLEENLVPLRQIFQKLAAELRRNGYAEA